MPRHAVWVRAGEGRASLHDDLTNKIIYELEAGRVAWVQDDLLKNEPPDHRG